MDNQAINYIIELPFEESIQQPADTVYQKTQFEEEIIDGCIRNDRFCQKKLYERYFGKMMGITRRYIKDREDAIEVLNTGFFKIYNNISKYKSLGSFEGWMSRVIVNTALDHLRATKAYSTQVFYDENIEKKYDAPIDFNDFEDIDPDHLFMMIDRLPPVCKVVFNMYAVDGYSHKEIAKSLGISTGTTKAHVSFARKKLKEMLLNFKSKEIS